MDKAYIAGEYDWTDRYSRLPLLGGLIPVLLVGSAYVRHIHFTLTLTLKSRHCWYSCPLAVGSASKSIYLV